MLAPSRTHPFLTPLPFPAHALCVSRARAPCVSHTELSKTVMFLGYYSGHAVSLVLGTMYPVYRSFKSLQPGTPSEQWLPYW